MKRRNFLKTTALTAAALGTSSLHSYAALSKRPNVIVILTDDQGYGDFSLYGNPILKTPFMDRLASESVRFTDFHVTPVCTPTRSQLMTGLDCMHNLACAVTAGRTLMRRNIPTMAEFFNKAGYTTGLFGKWHLGHAYPDRPMDKGFDKCIWFKGWGLQSEIEFDNDYVNPRYLDGLEQKQASVYCTDLWFQEAIAWMTQQQKKDQPFFTYLAANVPHMPLWPPENATDMYKDKTDPATADYFAMIANLDDNIGKLDDWLKKSGLYKDTVVVFLSDNGGISGLKVHTAGLRESKASNYEGGHRVPCFLRYPEGGFQAGLDVSTPTEVQDLLPTLLELCKVSSKGAAFDGVSLTPLLNKKPIKDRIFVVQYGERQRPIKYDAAVVWNQWRLQNGKELYDIVKDLGQTTDVAAQNPEIVRQMQGFYEYWWGNLKSELWQPIPMIIGTKFENPVLLTSIDWWEVDADNINYVSQAVGGPRGGLWTIQAESAGNYRIELRRWPFHTNKPIGSEGPRETIRGRKLDHKYQLIPANEAVLAINGVQKQVSVTPESVGAEFQVSFPKGISQMRGWFRDKDGKDLCGAFYARVTKLPA
jgi:arylsulfatase A-like enzyme